jgi:uncharacterized membrane protein HdeD (DUF308 family)
MSMIIEVDELTVEPRPPSPVPWGWYLAAGIGWFVIGLSILSWNPVTISLISILVAGVVILAGIHELITAFVDPGWRWLHAIVGVVFIALGIAAFTNPFQTFAGLAVLFGWFLILKGMVVTIVALAVRGPGTLWGLGLAVGLMNLLIGLWALGYPDRSAWLLVLWIGIGALMHGIWDIVEAFAVRAAR